jgi:hypothetical protein
VDQEKKNALRGHTGTTQTGSVRDVRIERIGRVTIYKRGSAYYVYYRELGRTVRRRVDGNLATARIGASKVNAAITWSQTKSPVFDTDPNTNVFDPPDCATGSTGDKGLSVEPAHPAAPLPIV